MRDREHARLLEMLIGAGADTEPCIIGDIDEPAGSLTFRHCFVREDRLIADQRNHARRARHVHSAMTIAGDEAADNFGELHQADALQQ